MATAKHGDTVTVHYEARLPDGTSVHTTRGNAPACFTLGAGEVLPGFEEAVEGMDVGETRSVWIAADRAFGPHRDDLLLTVPPERFPPTLHLEVGQRLQMKRQGEPLAIVTVVDLEDGAVILDANHPLAGQDLVFDLELVGLAAGD